MRDFPLGSSNRTHNLVLLTFLLYLAYTGGSALERLSASWVKPPAAVPGPKRSSSLNDMTRRCRPRGRWSDNPNKYVKIIVGCPMHLKAMRDGIKNKYSGRPLCPLFNLLEFLEDALYLFEIEPFPINVGCFQNLS